MGNKSNSEALQLFMELEKELPPKTHDAADPEETLKTMQGLLKMFFNDRLRHDVRSNEDHERICSLFAGALKESFLAFSGKHPSPEKKARRKMNLSPEERARRSKQMKDRWAKKRRETKAAEVKKKAVK